MPARALPSPHHRLRDAVRAEHAVHIRQAIVAGADPEASFNEAAPQGLLPWVLHRALCRKGSDGRRWLTLFHFLLQYGANLHRRFDQDETLWFLWAREGVSAPDAKAQERVRQTAQWMQTAGLDPRTPSRFGHTVLGVALEEEAWTQVDWLVQAGVGFEGTACAPQDALFLLILSLQRHGLHEIAPEAAHWLEVGLQQSPEALNRVGRPALSLAEAAAESHITLIQRLHRAGVDWDLPLSDKTFQHVVRVSDLEKTPRPEDLATVRQYIYWHAREQLKEDPDISEGARINARHVLAYFDALALQQQLSDTLTLQSAPVDRRRL